MTEQSPAEAVFFAALVRGTAAAQAAYLDAACAGEPALRARVERLLAAHPKVGDFLADPPPAATVTAGDFAATADPDGTCSRSAPVGEAGQVIAGRYKLLERIGEGGMGSVWMADQTEPVKRKVAVKLIKTGMDTKTVLARFEAERQALALMDHPNIAKVLDGGTTDAGQPFFVMELVKGVPITDFCDARKLTPQQRLELFVPVCQAIQHAHQKGVIHRDIKPSNVLVALYDDKPVPKVIDFGVAKATGPTLTEHTLNTGFGGIVGTPQYMSPEQATFNNLDIDTRSDVYSLGVLLYELLAGSPPFKAKELEKRGLLEMLRVVREEEPPKPSTKLSTADSLPSLSANRGMAPKTLTGLLRNELDWIVMKALEKDRTRRYETANGFAADVQRYLSGEQVLAHPPSAGYRLRKWVGKHKVAVLTACVIWLITLTQVGFSTLQWLNADRAHAAETVERQKAEQARIEAVDQRRTADEQRRLVEYRAAVVSVDAALESAKPSSPEGLVRLAGTLKLLPPDATALRQGVVTNLFVWGQEFAPPYTRPGGHIHAVSPDGRIGLISSFGQTHTWEARDLLTGRRLAQLGDEGTAETGPYYEDRGGWAVFSGDGKSAATLHVPNTADAPSVRVWDVSTWRERFHLRPAGGTHEVWLNGHGTRLVTRSAVPNPKPADESDDRQFFVHLWDASTGEKVATLDHGGKRVDHVRFSPDGRVLLSASESVVRLWSASDGRQLHILGPHTAPVVLTAFSPSGKTVAVVAGPRVYWWTVTDGSPAAPPLALGFTPSPVDGLFHVHHFAFETEEVLIAREWNVERSNFGRSDGGAVCVLGEAKAHTIDAVCSDGKYALTDDRHVYSLSPFRRLETPSGRKFPPEVRASANGRRYVQVGQDLIDLVAEVPVGSKLQQVDAGIYPVRATGFGFVIKKMGQHYWNSRQTLIPDPTALPANDVMELWAKVLARGHIDPDSGLFKKDDEGTWEWNRRELVRRAEPTGEFPFPGVASDPTYWLRQAYQEAKEASERLSLAERLVAVKPSWQNHLLRANAFADVGRNVEAIREDLRVQELAKDEYKYAKEEGRMAWGAARAILSNPGLPKAEYELALRWLRETTDEVPDIALALYRLDRPDEALKELTTLHLPRPTDLVAGLGSPWMAAVVSHVHARSLDRHWTSESTLPYVVESLCHSKLGNITARDWCLTTARKLIRSRDEMEDPLSPRNIDWYGPLVNEALRAERSKEK